MIVKRIIRVSLISVACYNLLSLNHLFAGLDDLPIGARSLGMGSTYAAIANTADAVFLNPGGLGQLSGIEVSLFYQKPFGLADLNFGTIALSLPISHRRLSAGFMTLGNGAYREQAFLLAYSHHFQRKVFYGIGLSYKSIQIDNYGSTGTLGLDLGIVVPINSEVKLGFLTKNINRPTIGASGENLPQTFKSGVSLKPKSNLLLSFELHKEVRFPVEMRFGVEFKPLNDFAIRAGTANNPSRFSAGFGVAVNLFSVDYAFFTHNDLGLTHQFSFSVHIDKKEDKQPPETEPVVATQASESSEETPEATQAAKEDREIEKIDINNATIDELETLPGIGEKLAQAIVRFREQNGRFDQVEDLVKVPGIGEKKLEKIIDKIFVRKISRK